MEIEAKFRVEDERTFTDLLGLTALGPFRLSPAPEPEDQRNVYFDTADGRLRAARYGLRVRDLGARRIATLKGASHVADGVYERDEWEVDVTDDQPETWPASEARERTLALLGGATLAPILTIRTLRRHIYVARGTDEIAEISLDEGTISAGGREQRFRELEIELSGRAVRTDLDRIAELLRARYLLTPEDRSKLARGLALLDDRPTANSTNPRKQGDRGGRV